MLRNTPYAEERIISIENIRFSDKAYPGIRCANGGKEIFMATNVPCDAASILIRNCFSKMKCDQKPLLQNETRSEIHLAKLKFVS